uniref:AT-rich interactive domain-containing protein 3 n=1 Tax=Salarias fasciatus TaxID=181472 RepID=A0A672GCP1_SALFA
MVDNASLAVSALPGAAATAPSPPGASRCSPPPPAAPQPGGMRLEAVMENLQRQQAARLALEEKLRQADQEKDLRCAVESHIQQQALAFRHYQAAVRGALAAGVSASAARGTLPHLGVRRGGCGESPGTDPEPDEQEAMEEEEEEEEEPGDQYQGAGLSPDISLVTRVPAAFAPGRRPESPPGPQQPQAGPQHEWTYEEQFKQALGPGGSSPGGSSPGGSSPGGSSPGGSSLYELDDDEKRKEFLDDLFSFMQKRGTPVNRIPIMAKQVLDLYMLYKLVTEKGGLVEVINKKIWREITKGLNLPTSITSAAFTLRTQYMKYLYPYECEKRGLSSPGELQAAIDSNRREGRRQSYGSALFSYSPVATPTLLSSPKISMAHLSMPAHNSSHVPQLPGIKKEEPLMPGGLPGRAALPMSPGGPHAAAAAQAAALEQLREKLEAGEPPEKKMMLMAEEQQRMMQHALQHNLLAMASQLPVNISFSLSPSVPPLLTDDRQETALNLSTNGISSINMSIEINGVVYTGTRSQKPRTQSQEPGTRSQKPRTQSQEPGTRSQKQGTRNQEPETKNPEPGTRNQK